MRGIRAFLWRNTMSKHLLLGVAVLLSSGGVRAEDWPQFLGPTRNGVSPEAGLDVTWPKEGPRVVWECEVGAGWSSPVVANGLLILFHRQGDQEIVACLDAASGKEQWKFAYATRYEDDFGFDPGPRAAPLVAGKHIYTLGAEGMMHCLELATGKKVWERALK